ncbi:hypothetical protein BDV96DRAFT_591373 [Lophiotrema nucula]|uniref:Uncharacterized protein n=1 Tax=Lophiotrema nucula TaxID=690887 RepID=A0A6A5YGY5_9PLEO|nr:hypothetical protein BDV96DRAFT_591373 [Lophiotrema nucula]
MNAHQIEWWEKHGDVTSGLESPESYRAELPIIKFPIENELIDIPVYAMDDRQRKRWDDLGVTLIQNETEDVKEAIHQHIGEEWHLSENPSIKFPVGNMSINIPVHAMDIHQVQWWKHFGVTIMKNEDEELKEAFYQKAEEEYISRANFARAIEAIHVKMDAMAERFWTHDRTRVLNRFHPRGSGDKSYGCDNSGYRDSCESLPAVYWNTSAEYDIREEAEPVFPDFGRMVEQAQGSSGFDLKLACETHHYVRATVQEAFNFWRGQYFEDGGFEVPIRDTILDLYSLPYLHDLQTRHLRGDAEATIVIRKASAQLKDFTVGTMRLKIPFIAHGAMNVGTLAFEACPVLWQLQGHLPEMGSLTPSIVNISNGGMENDDTTELLWVGPDLVTFSVDEAILKGSSAKGSSISLGNRVRFYGIKRQTQLHVPRPRGAIQYMYAAGLISWDEKARADLDSERIDHEDLRYRDLVSWLEGVS